MKKLTAFLLTICFTAAVQAASFKVSPDEKELIVLDKAGKEVAKLPNPSIGQIVEVDGGYLSVSFGNDINNIASVIISPAPQNPMPIAVEVISITGAKTAISGNETSTVTVAFKGGSVVAVESGLAGQVQVNGQPLTSGTNVGINPSTGGTSSVPAQVLTQASSNAQQNAAEARGVGGSSSQSQSQGNSQSENSQGGQNNSGNLTPKFDTLFNPGSPTAPLGPTAPINTGTSIPFTSVDENLINPTLQTAPLTTI